MFSLRVAACDVRTPSGLFGGQPRTGANAFRRLPDGHQRRLRKTLRSRRGLHRKSRRPGDRQVTADSRAVADGFCRPRQQSAPGNQYGANEKQGPARQRHRQLETGGQEPRRQHLPARQTDHLHHLSRRPELPERSVGQRGSRGVREGPQAGEDRAGQGDAGWPRLREEQGRHPER